MELELRKQKEREHANKIKTLLEGVEDREKVASNKKFYTITHSSQGYINNWLFGRVGRGKKFLDYCCGTGEFSISLARNGANVTGIDISDVSIKIAKENATKYGLRDKIDFLVMDAEKLEFNDNTFDTIVCGGVLHHLDIEKAYSELARVLSPNGEIICGEPLAYNPIFQLYRKLTPHLRTEWEAGHILNKKSINLSKHYFNKIELRMFHLTTLLAVPFRHFSSFSSILRIFEKIDSVLLKVPLIKWLAWQVVFILSRPKK